MLEQEVSVEQWMMRNVFDHQHHHVTHELNDHVNESKEIFDKI
jgi:hypothetical protein